MENLILILNYKEEKTIKKHQINCQTKPTHHVSDHEASKKKHFENDDHDTQHG